MSQSKFKKQGTVYSIGELMVFPSKSPERKPFSKRAFVLEVNSQHGDGNIYKDFLEFETVQTFTAFVDSIAVGDDVEVEFTIGGRLWTSPEGTQKCFVSLKCWNVVVLSKSAEKLSFNDNKQEQDDEPSFDLGEPIDSDDLPF